MSTKKKIAVTDAAGLHLIFEEDGNSEVATWDDEKTAKTAVAESVGAKRMPNGYRIVRLTEEELAELNAARNTAESEGEPEDVVDGEPVDEEPIIEPTEILPAALPDPAEGIDLGTADLDTLIAVIKADLGHVAGHARGLVVYAWHAGRALHAAHDKVADGEWLGWLKDNFELSQPTAWRYMRLATCYATVNAIDSELSITGALKALEPKPDRKPREKKDKADTEPDFDIGKWMAEGEWALCIGADGRKLLRTNAGMVDLEQGIAPLDRDTATKVSEMLSYLTARLDAYVDAKTAEEGLDNTDEE